MENIIFEIILHAGDARSQSIKAYKLIQKNDFDGAKELLKKASESINLAHKTQTELIQKEVRGDHQDVTLLMVHAQDHLSGAQVIMDIVSNTVSIVQNLDNRVKKLEEEKNE